jgi:hypothetical protein
MDKLSLAFRLSISTRVFIKHDLRYEFNAKSTDRGAKRNPIGQLQVEASAN